MIRQYILASDPGLVRLYLAVRATASVGTALAILIALRGVLHLQLPALLVGIPLGMIGNIGVTDAGHRDQKITTLLLCVPASFSTVAATLAAPNVYLSDALFVMVLFLAVYVRQYGPRYAALATILFISFFFAVMFRMPPSGLPWAMLSIVLADLATFCFRFAVFRDNAKLALRNAIAAFRARQQIIAAAHSHSAIQHNLFRLNETSLLLHGILKDPQDRASVLEAELATADGNAEPLQLREGATFDSSWTPSPPSRVGTQMNTGRIPQAVRQALQLSAAGVLAILLGHLISPERWYWAVLTAFFVFMGTSSSVETRNRAWSRAAGTALGVLAAMLIAYFLHGHNRLAYGAMMVSLFAAVYSFRINYSAFTFFVTIVIAMVYELLGLFTDALMILRFAETLAGAVLGGVAATLLLPVSTKRLIFNVTVEALRRLDDFVGVSVDFFAGDTRANRIDAVRKVDEAMQSVQTQIVPMTRRNAGEIFSTRLMLMSAISYYVRALATLSPDPSLNGSLQALREQRAAIHEDIEAIITYGQGGTALNMPRTPLNDAAGPASSYLRNIDRTLHGFARTLTVQM